MKTRKSPSHLVAFESAFLVQWWGESQLAKKNQEEEDKMEVYSGL